MTNNMTSAAGRQMRYYPVRVEGHEATFTSDVYAGSVEEALSLARLTWKEPGWKVTCEQV